MKPSDRDCITDLVLKRLADSDHDTLILARRLQARGPHTETFHTHNVHGLCEDNDSNQGHISDTSASQAEPDDTETASRNDSTPPPTEEQQASTATPASGRSVEDVFLIEPQSQEAAEVIQTTTTEGQQQEGITEAVTEGTTAFNELRGNGSKGIRRVRDNTTNKSLAVVVVRRATAVIRRFSSLAATRGSTDRSSQVGM